MPPAGFDTGRAADFATPSAVPVSAEGGSATAPAAPVTSGPTVAAPVKPAETGAGQDAGAGEPADDTATAKYVSVDKDGARVRGYLGIPGVTD